MRLQTRLTLSFVAVLIVGMGLAGFLAWRTAEQLYLQAQRENLMAQARLTAAALGGVALPAAPVEPYMQTANVAAGIHTRILGEQGAVLIGLPLTSTQALQAVPEAEQADAVPADALLGRPEIQSALRGEAATAVRRVASAGGQRVLYAAAPILDPEGALTGIAYLAMPLPAGGLPPQAGLQLAGAALAAVALAGLTGTLLARRLARPMVRLARASAAVRAGDLAQTVPHDSGTAEIDSLGAAFNAMTAGLRQSDQAKTAFLADVTHELRTPLTVIKGTIETLQDGAVEDADGRGPLLASMEREADRLIRLVGELLVLTRADAGALGLKLRPVDLGTLARQRAQVFGAVASRRGIELRLETGSAPSPGDLVLPGDADRLAQVFDNLLDNALRHAPDRSAITIDVRSEAGGVRCTVRDQGAGIPPEHLPLVFERFYRVDAARDRRAGGAGLGLAIARALVEAHGGRIGAESAPGSGTSVSFWLPLAPRLPAS